MSKLGIVVGLTLITASEAVAAAPVVPVAVFSEVPPKRGALPKIVSYLNEDISKTTAVTTTTPIYGQVYNPRTKKYETKIIGTTRKTVKSTVITPKAELISTNGNTKAFATPVVNFRFLAQLPTPFRALLSGNQSAFLSLDAFSASAPVLTGGTYSQLFESGTIAFHRTVPIQFYSPTHHPVGGPKSNLLTVAFTNATLQAGNGGTAFSLFASSPASTLTFTSDFLNFTNATSHDFSLAFGAATPAISLAAIDPTLTNVSGARTLNTTKASVTGQFSASSVPEPAVWSLLLGGFAMIGIRRRRPITTRVAA